MNKREAIDVLISLGYSENESRAALEENEWSLDDAIDFLFTKGKAGKHTSVKKTSAATFCSDDVSVADSFYTSVKKTSAGTLCSDDVSVADSFYSKAPKSEMWATRYTPSLSLMAIQETTNLRTPDTLSSSAPLVPSGKDPYKEQRDIRASLAIGQQPALYRSDDFKSVMGNSTVTSAESGATRISSRTSAETPITEARRPNTRPGAIREGASSDTVSYDVTSGSVLPYVREIEAELVDPDQENQVLERRLQEELERERGRVAMAEAIPESELKMQRRKFISLIAGIMIILVSVALSVSLTVGGRSTTGETAPSTPVPTTPSPPPEEIIALISPVSFDNGESLYDPFSPQSEAARWLANNANLASYTDKRKIQRYALATLYYSTFGDDWKETQGWLSDENECFDWWRTEYDAQDARLRCDDGNAITILRIQQNELAGTLPEEIAFLSDTLFMLEAYENNIQGTLPTTLGLLKHLVLLNLQKNNITGDLPTELGSMASLEQLLVDHNNIHGTVFTELALMTSLRRLRLQDNDLSGAILGSTFGALTNLDVLTLSENTFTGTVPIELGRIVLLEDLQLERNNLTGPFPSELGALSLMEEFCCHSNFLTGPLPTEIGLWTLVKKFRIVDNSFTGPIPSEMANMVSLERLRMGENNFTGTILPALGLLPMLNRIELDSNLLTGTIPSEFGLLTLMSDFRLHANNLTGTILSEFGQFTDLKGLNLHNNSFTGTLPEFGYLTRLKDLRAGFNMLTGTIPNSVSHLTRMEEIMLSSNMLTGTIPEVIFDFTSLQKVYLFNNSFTGNTVCPTTLEDCYLSCFIPDNETCRTL